MKHSRILASFIACLLALTVIGPSQPAQAATGDLQLSIDPSTSPIVVNGVFDGKTTTFTGSARLTIRGAGSAKVRLLASDLLDSTQKGLATKISRADVSMPSDAQLSEGQPTDIAITINNVKRAGSYSGQLEFVATSSTSPTQIATATTKIELHIDAQPIIKSVLPNIALQVVNCSGALDCTLATWFLPRSAIRDHWAIPLENDTSSEATVSQGVVVMRGEKTGMVVQRSEMSITVFQKLPANMVESLDLQIARADLPADRYQGTLRLKIDGAEEALAINSTIEVRNGPLLAILAVIFGIIIGRLVRNRQSPLSQKQENLFPRLKELSASAGALKDQELRQYIEEEIKKARASVASSNEDEATVSQHVVEIGKKIGLLVRLEQDNEWLANTMTKESDPNKKLLMSPLTTYNNEVAGLIRTNMEAASKQLEEFEGKLAAAGMPAPGTRGGKRGGVEQPGTAPNEADNIPPSASGWSQLVQIGGKVLQVALHFVLGVDAMAVEQRFWFVKSLLFLVLLILLALIGLQTLYVNNGAIFGVNGIYDYIGLFLWGMSAEVAQRTLQDLGTPRSKS